MSAINFPLRKSTYRHWPFAFLLLLAVAVAFVTWKAWPTNAGGPTSGANQPQALWQVQDIDSYRYTLTLSCFCPLELVQPAVVEVINGELASLTYANNSEPADPMLFERYTSIDKLHEIIAEAEEQNPARLDVMYDPSTGVPLYADIDISELMADEEIRFTVTGFEQLP